MAGPLFPSCQFILTPAIEQVDPTTIKVTWGGACTTYKLKYRVTGTLPWTTVTMAGPGSLFPGSTYFTNPVNPPQVNPGVYAPLVTADFTLTPLVVGEKYDLELINVCIDGSEYTLPLFYQVPMSCAPIINFIVVSEINGVVKVSWDAVAGVTKYFLVVHAEGEEDDDEFETDTNSYTLNNLIPGVKYTLNVNYECEGGEIISEPLSVIACACTDEPPVEW